MPDGEVVVIELLGAPGAGKTTLLPAVRRACRRAGLSPYGVVEAARPFAARGRVGRLLLPLGPRARRIGLWGWFRLASDAHAARFAAAHPDLVLDVLRSQRNRPRGAEGRDRKVLRWYVRMVGASSFLAAHARLGEALILDEGFVHRVVQLFASSVETPDAARVRRYLSLVPPPDVIVHVRTSTRLGTDRIESRGAWPRFAGRDRSELESFVANAHRATELAASTASSWGWSVIEVDNGADADRPLAEVEAEVEARLSVFLDGMRAEPAGVSR